MMRISIDRLTELLAALCTAAAVIFLVHSAGVPAAEGSLAGLTAQTVPEKDLGRFRALLAEARRGVDGNRDPEVLLRELKEEFPGRHEVWALSGRHAESKGSDREALRSYARAVRLQPDYLDDNSPMYLGRRIEAITERVMGGLDRDRKDGVLNAEGKELLKTAYFVRRRLAGGCE